MDKWGQIVPNSAKRGQLKDLLQDTHCLFLGSVTGDYCLFLGSFYPDSFSIMGYFKAEGGLQGNFHLVYSVSKGDIFDIRKKIFW